ncbi:hypothetical protein [Candidatus Symbiopectobacterium sp.]|uniref:hypothetical protein n=1 Tax=Candidatus Symbiopectobacterium sp. TaxID=2816440 RepID=UPI0025BB5AC9|nr:hypothetical protein [Candidatus Symbiopectobacterium sp.]
MATFAITVFFHRRCLFTKRASYVNFSHCIPHPKPDISHCNQHIEYTTQLLNSAIPHRVILRSIPVG